MADIEEIARQAIDCGFKIHKELGPGLLESVYEAVLSGSLERLGLVVDRQKPIAFEYQGMVFREGFRVDLLVDGRLIIEVKSIDRLAPVHGKQVLTYLRLLNQPLGLLMNFGGATFWEGVRRIVNNHTDFASSRLRVNQVQDETGEEGGRLPPSASADEPERAFRWLKHRVPPDFSSD